MPTLPLEVLMIIFKYLKPIDLLQCQLTSKEWYTASIDRLYSEIELHTGEKARLYARTISNSSHLGNHLKIIHTEWLFSIGRFTEQWDEHDILNLISRKCPNLLKLNSVEQELSFWIRLSHAASQGHFSHLQLLPCSNTRNLESYLFTALQFKSSLRHLSISDKELCHGIDLKSLGVYQTLLDQIGEFKSLQTFTLAYQSDKQLTHFNDLIEDCPHLQEVSIVLFPTEDQKMIMEPVGVSVYPRPGIRKLECNWDIISTKNQVKYVIQKFPNLQSLKVKSYYFQSDMPARYCPGAVMNFLRYATSIPEFDIDLEVGEPDLTNLVLELMKMKYTCGDIGVSFFESRPHQNKVVLKLEATKLTLWFPLIQENAFVVSSWFKFFSEIGSKIRSIRFDELWEHSRCQDDELVYPTSVSDDFNEIRIDLDNIFDIIRDSPSVQEFVLHLNVFRVTPSSYCVVPPNQKVNKLTVIDAFDSDVSVLTELLQVVSIQFPNIKQIHLRQDEFKGRITIDMSYSHLDLLTWICEDRIYEIDASFEVYIRYKSEKRTKFYIGSATGLLPIKSRRYKLEERCDSLCFDITCKSLTEFRICVKSSPSCNFVLNF